MGYAATKRVEKRPARKPSIAKWRFDRTERVTRARTMVMELERVVMERDW